MSEPPGPPLRLAAFAVDDLDDDRRALYDTITGGPRAQGPQVFALVDDDGRLRGPFNAMLLSPAVGKALQELGAAVRYRSALSDRSREIAILTVAHQAGSSFEIQAHEAIGRSVGLTDEELAGLRAGRGDAFSDRPERVVAEATAALMSNHDLDDHQFREVEAVLGAEGLFELTTVVGYYALLALQMRVFRV